MIRTIVRYTKLNVVTTAQSEIVFVITIIILLILAGVAISMITGGEGLFAKANHAATKYNQAAKNEADLINELLNGNYLKNGGKEGTTINNDSHVGYYADLDPKDGKIDGIIFADLAVGGSVKLTFPAGVYPIPVKTGLKEYYVSKEEHEGAFGTKGVLSPKEGSTGEDRFYIMALEDFNSTTYAWYYEAERKMTDYAEATSVEFGKGRANTAKMIEYWNNKTYGEQNTGGWYKDMWGEIQEKVNEGWFVPSRAELGAFIQELEITDTNYADYGISDIFWSSSQYDDDRVYSFYLGYVSCVRFVDCNSYARLAMTF